MLSAIPGFKQISGRRLSNDEVGTSDRRLATLPWSQHLNLCQSESLRVLGGFAQTAAGFAQGTKGLIDLMKGMDKTAKVRERRVSVS
jgi:hypothetical protein